MEEISSSPSSEAPMLTVDLEVYKPLFEDESISDADKLKLLETLWSIVVSFAQIGWGVHPTQQARTASENACGLIGNSATAQPSQGNLMIKSDVSSVSGEFDNAADALPQKVTSP